jgi:hypothetical protein
LNLEHPRGSVLRLYVENSTLCEKQAARATERGGSPSTSKGPARAGAGGARPSPRAIAEPVRPDRAATPLPTDASTHAGELPRYLVECPICEDQVDHAWSEPIAWAWATVHDEVEGHEAGTAFVVRA